MKRSLINQPYAMTLVLLIKIEAVKDIVNYLYPFTIVGDQKMQFLVMTRQKNLRR
jgi:hypothetical protein